jgi:hypothetical protein
MKRRTSSSTQTTFIRTNLVQTLCWRFNLKKNLVQKFKKGMTGLKLLFLNMKRLKQLIGRNSSRLLSTIKLNSSRMRVVSHSILNLKKNLSSNFCRASKSAVSLKISFWAKTLKVPVPYSTLWYLLSSACANE